MPQQLDEALAVLLDKASRISDPFIAQGVAARVPEVDHSAEQSLIVEELRRLHEGVLARYGLRPSEFAAWKAQAMP